MRDYSRLDNFLNQLETTDIGNMSWEECPQHLESVAISNSILQQSIDILYKNFNSLPSWTVLDVGCGSGLACKLFKQLGCNVHGLTLFMEPALVKISKELNIPIIKCDQSFITPAADASFDLVYARHVLEHSIMPYFTLTEYFRILKPEGICYIEIPHPNTHANNEENKNHYSVLGIKMWESLFTRAGFKICSARTITISGIPTGKTEVGDIDYWESYILRKIL